MMFRTHQRGLKKPPHRYRPQDNILLQRETTKESPSIEKQDMSHLPKRKEQPQSPNTNVNLPLRTEQPIAREIQDDSPKSHSPET
ncbi:hypothetical protein G5714_004344 [Onychostoma macrolepis]|uniref:Uncharacterized protein n=1 Tax=Onychostoma macrolepis TaxID=369639 RepID=A0A7J6D4G7_9TELE|nr:hypothetical protein G5714_004344 [Onychostoma macrolepis]